MIKLSTNHSIVKWIAITNCTPPPYLFVYSDMMHICRGFDLGFNLRQLALIAQPPLKEERP